MELVLTLQHDLWSRIFFIHLCPKVTEQPIKGEIEREREEIDSFPIFKLEFPSWQGEWNVSLPAGTMVKVLADYTALKEDEISVSRGETIQVSAYFWHLLGKANI